MRSILFTLLFVLLSIKSSAAQEGDNFLLDLLPGILSSTSWSRPALEPIRKLSGGWTFAAFYTSKHNTYFRFEQKTATLTGGPLLGLQKIYGDSSTSSDFSLEWCDGKLVAIYYHLYDDYNILCDWGYPSMDIGTVFSFSSVDDTFDYAERFYRPSDNTYLNDLPYNFGIATKTPYSPKVLKLDNSASSRLKMDEHEKLLIEKYKKMLPAINRVKVTAGAY